MSFISKNTLISNKTSVWPIVILDEVTYQKPQKHSDFLSLKK